MKTRFVDRIRYTHRIGITNKRILALDEDSRAVSIAYKDYADESRPKVMTLASGEFVRRFCLHILSPPFVKIRHYCFLSNRNRSSRVAEPRAAFGPDPKATVEHTEIESAAVAPATADTLLCPDCGKLGLVLVRVIRPPRSRSAGYDDTS